MNRLRVAPLAAVVLVLAAAALLSGAIPASGQTPPTLDNFNRADENPLSGGGNWAQTDAGTWPTPMQLVSNAARRGSNTSASYWTQTSFAGGEGSVWAKWGGIGDQSGVGIALYKDVGGASAVDGYELRREVAGIVENDYYILRRVDNGVRQNPALAAVENTLETSYPYFNLRRIGNTVEAWASPDGGTWTLVLSAQDATHTTGTYFASIHSNSTGPAGQFLDDFGAATSGVPQPTTLTVVKTVVNDNGGAAAPSNWTMNVAGPTPLSFPGAASPGTTNTVQPGSYVVTESGGPAGYTLSYSGDCDAAGNVTIATGQTKTCVLTNNDLVPGAGRSYGTFGGRGTFSRTGTRTRFDPVNTFTGFFVHQDRDLSTPGTGVALDWTRSYTSGDPTGGPLGAGWTHTYAASLAVQGNGDVLARGEEGQEVDYTRQANGSFVGAAGALATLTSVAGGYELKRSDQVVYTFNASGRLLSIKDRNDQGVTLAYDGSGRLQTITDADGRQTTVSYNAQSLVSQVSTAGGRSVSYGYTSGRLTSFTDVRGKVWTYTYDAAGRLATIVDPMNHTRVTNVYGANDRVTSQTDAVGKTTTFAWDSGTEVATITDANNKVWKDDYANGVIVKEIDALLNETLLGHDADLNETAVTSPTSQQTTMTYDAAGNLLTATAPPSLGGAQKTFVYNGRNDPTQITDARGKVTSYTYTPTGNTASVTQDGTPMGSYTYDAAGRVLTFTDGNSKTTTYTYFPASGYLESSTDPLGNKTTYTYDAAGRVLTRVDPKGNCSGCTPANFTWSYTYNAAGQVLTETDPLGKVTTHAYDDAGNELTVTDANGKTTTYTYDNANRLLSVTAPDTGVTSYTYDNVGNKLTETDPRNNTTTHTYTSANQLASTTTASGAKTTFFYDANGNLVKQVEPRGNVAGADPNDFDTIYTYDAAGRLLTETDPLGNVTTHAYDAVGNELTLTDANNKTTTSTYDGKNRLATVTAPDGGVTTYTYDPVGNKLTEKDPRNNTTTFAYDDANRLASVTKPAGGRTTYGYDPNGNQTTMVEPRGNVSGCACAAQFTWTYAYDRVNRKLSETSPLGHTTTFAYDNVGNQLSVTDAKSHTTAYTYDGVNRLKTVTAPDTGVTTHTYDLAGNLTQRKDARNNTTTYAYDVDNRRTTVTSPLSKVWTTSYDPAGNVAQMVDANGNATPVAGDGQTNYTYDRAGRMTAIDYSDSTPDVTFNYDAVGNRLSVVDGQGTETRTYDPVNRLAGVVRGSDAFAYTYDLAGNLTSRTYPGSVQTIHTYDADNRMATAVNAALTTSYGYDPAGNLTQTTLPAANGYVETRLYDNAGRLSEVKNQKGASVLSRFVVTRDQVGNPTSVDRTGSLTQVQNYTYDVNDRLLSVCYAASCTASSPNRIAWTYDLVGNRLTETRSTGTTNSTYNAGDQLLSAGSTSYSYDSNGNALSAGSRAFTWDLANRLRSMTQGNTTTTYLYDADGKRLQASTGAQANRKTNFLWDVSHPLPQLALERDGGGSLQRQYVYGLARIRQSASTPSYYHYDGLGSVANLTSSAGTTTQWTWSYEPYGSIRTEQKANGNQPDNFLKFTGEYLDPTGLYHLRARQYDSINGRFLTVDPVEPAPNSPSISAFVYAGNSPVTFTDPSGLTFVPSRGGVLAARSVGCTPGVSVGKYQDVAKYLIWKGLYGGIVATLRMGAGTSTGECPIFDFDPASGKTKIHFQAGWLIEDIALVPATVSAGWEAGAAPWNRAVSWDAPVARGNARFIQSGRRIELPGADLQFNVRFRWDPPSLVMKTETERLLPNRVRIRYGSEVETWWIPRPQQVAAASGASASWLYVKFVHHAWNSAAYFNPLSRAWQPRIPVPGGRTPFPR